MEEERSANDHLTRVAVALLEASLPVHVPKLAIGGGEPIGKARRSPRGGGRRAPEHETRPPLRAGARRDLHDPAPVLERFSRPGAPKGSDALFDQRRSFVERTTRHLELALDIAGGDRQLEAPPAHEVDQGGILGDAQRVV
jgi:hypothetical protein